MKLTLAQYIARTFCFAGFKANDSDAYNARYLAALNRGLACKAYGRETSATHQGMNGNDLTMPERIFR